MPDTQIVAFRASDDGQEHVALVIGAFGGEPPLVRLHSECLTGDVFGSLKCDCGPQLKEALRDHRREPAAGCCSTCARKGAGSASPTSCAPMRCRTAGSTRSTPTARLGFADDERDYAHAAAMLRALGIDGCGC